MRRLDGKLIAEPFRTARPVPAWGSVEDEPAWVRQSLSHVHTQSLAIGVGGLRDRMVDTTVAFGAGHLMHRHEICAFKKVAQHRRCMRIRVNSLQGAHRVTSCLALTQQQLQLACYFALEGGTMPFIRRYSTIWP